VRLGSLPKSLISFTFYFQFVFVRLNFYGFRKLRTDPILTSEIDPGTSCYVRFYHEHFQRDQPELLQQIKRATKGEQQSKDDLDSLRKEIRNLKDTLRNTVTEYDRKLAELSYECNRRITSMIAEYDKIAAMVQGALGSNIHRFAAMAANPVGAGMHHPLGVGAPGAAPLQVPVNADLLHSLSQAAVSLQDNARANMLANSAVNANAAAAAAALAVSSEMPAAPALTGTNDVDKSRVAHESSNV
jgi:HSF-type DNA-binding